MRFAGNRAASSLVQFNAEGNGKKGRILFPYAKTMILFTSRPMPREHAGRETQKLGVYCTDHTLTGRSTSFLHYWLTSHNSRQLFSADRTLTDALRLRSQTSRPATADRTFGAGRCSQDARHLYFTDCTLTGDQRLFAIDTGNHHCGELSLQLRREIYFTNCILTGGAAPRPPPCICHAGGPVFSARSAPTFSYQLQFDWQPAFVRPACELGSASVGTSAKGPITDFSIPETDDCLACCAPRDSAPSFSHRSHFDW